MEKCDLMLLSPYLLFLKTLSKCLQFAVVTIHKKGLNLSFQWRKNFLLDILSLFNFYFKVVPFFISLPLPENGLLGVTTRITVKIWVSVS